MQLEEFQPKFKRWKRTQYMAENGLSVQVLCLRKGSFLLALCKSRFVLKVCCHIFSILMNLINILTLYILYVWFNLTVCIWIACVFRQFFFNTQTENEHKIRCLESIFFPSLQLPAENHLRVLSQFPQTRPPVHCHRSDIKLCRLITSQIKVLALRRLSCPQSRLNRAR